ncbi:MAG: alkyl hydroperoxide reductase subunit F [Oceanococcaceae bacterium]
MLTTDLQAQLKGYMERLTRDVVLTAYTDDSPKSEELRALLTQIGETSTRISVTDADASDGRTPRFSISSQDDSGHDVAVTFAGIPLGHEFTSLVLALLHVGGHPGKISDELATQIRNLPGEYHFETYFSLSCQSCPDVVQALNLMATLNPRITHEAIDGALFQSEVETREVMSVPSVFLNGEFFAAGRMSIEDLVAKLDTQADARAAEALAQKDPFDVLIVGGGPAGAAAAIYAARKGVRTGVVAERFGGQVVDTLGIENFVSVNYTEGPKLVTALEQHVADYEVDVMKRQTATALEETTDGYRLTLESGATLQARSVILSTGARWRQMNVPGEDEYRNKGVAYCPHCDGPLFKGKRVAVIGGGNSGVEAAIDLAGIVAHVTLIEFDTQLRADEVLQRKLRSLPNVTILTNAQTTEVTGDGNRVNGLVYKDRASGESHTVELEGIFVQIGLLPNSEWLKGTLELSPRGEVVVNDRNETSLPGVMAAGDVTTVPYKQIIIAMGAGSAAALSAFDHLMRTSAPAEASADAPTEERERAAA